MNTIGSGGQASNALLLQRSCILQTQTSPGEISMGISAVMIMNMAEIILQIIHFKYNIIESTKYLFTLDSSIVLFRFWPLVFSWHSSLPYLFLLPDAHF